MKIKTKKQLNLPQLIEWACENGVTNQIFRADKQLTNIQFDGDGDFGTMGFTDIDTTFTIEVEEEVTEDTKLDGLVELGDDGAGEDFFFIRGLSIKDCKDEFTQAFYILNDDYTMTLIWRDGKLVE